MKQQTMLVCVLGCAVVFLFSSVIRSPATVLVPASGSAKPGFSIGLGTGKMTGETFYKIGFPAVAPTGERYAGYFPFSKLEWPLDFWLATIDGVVTFNDRWRAAVSVSKNLSTPQNYMSDSDWLTPADPAQLDIYSEFRISSFEALIVDTDVEWLFFRQPAISFYVGAGVVYQKFDYESKLLYQYSPSGIEGVAYAGDGRTGITYEMTYSLPYVKIGADLHLAPGLEMLGSFAYSPIAQAEDSDHHLLREFGGKRASGDMDGTAYLIEVTGRYYLTPALFLEATGNYLHIEVDGSQYQEYGIGVPIGTFRQEAESSQTSAYVTLGYSF